MYVRLNKRWWRLRFVAKLNAAGECDSPDTKKKEIRIRESLKGEDRLDTIIHEALHACLWELDDDFVDTIASDIARVLWRLGYRSNDS